MATVERQSAGKMGYLWQSGDDALANGADIVITHGKDEDRKRMVTIINMADGSIAPASVTAVCTDDTTTTITNGSGGALNILASVFIPS